MSGGSGGVPPGGGGATEYCPFHPLRAGAWACVACGRSHCDACRGRTERRLTPLGTCLQCGGRLEPVQRSVDSPGLAGLVATWRQAYSPSGLLAAAALAVPVLYGSVVFTFLIPAVAITGFCSWTYLLAVVRYRLTGHQQLPTPARVLQDVRSAMAVPAALLAALLALSPALWLDAHGHGAALTVPLALLALLWLPVPILAGAAGPSHLGPLVPWRVVAAGARDPSGFLWMAVAATTQFLAVAAVGATLARWLVFLPFVGLWLTCIAVLPGLWAVASGIGEWGRAHLDDLTVEP